MRWTAIDHLGRLAGRYAEDNDALFRNIIRRFIWQMCEESANVPWASAEVVGSIIANVPGKRFEEFIGPLFYHTDLNDICYAGLYWVLPQLMRHHAEKVEEYLPNTYYWFDQFDMPDLRAYAAHYFRQYPHAEMEKHPRRLERRPAHRRALSRRRSRAEKSVRDDLSLRRIIFCAIMDRVSR